MAKPRYLQLTCVVHGARHEATDRVRDAFSAAGAFITDVSFFSGLQTVFRFEVAGDRLAVLAAAFEQHGLVLDRASRESIDGALVDTNGEIVGSLAVLFAEGDPDLKHEIPSVPG